MTNQTIIMISGWANSANCFNSVKKYLNTPHKIETFTPFDFFTSTNGEIRNNLIEYIKGLDTDVILMGWSMGALMALDVYSACQHNITAMISLAGAPSFCSTDNYIAGMNKRNLRAMRMALPKQTNVVLERFYQDQIHPKKFDEDEDKAFIKEAMTFGVEKLGEGLEYLLTVDTYENLQDIKIPVLLFHGKNDKVIPCEGSRLLAEEISSSSLIQLNDCGHDIVRLRGKFIASEINTFLEGLQDNG